MKLIEYRERKCDCCNSNDLEEIWQYEHVCNTRSDSYNWNVRNVICRKCGFSFVSPVPSDESLEEYYGDSFSIFSDQQIDYSIEKRLNVIQRCQNNIAATSYLEIGSNNSPEFLSKLSVIFSQIETVELNDDCSSTYSNLIDVPNEHIDIIASYFVLEHIANPKEFLSKCANILRDDGLLIIEVPNLYLYPKDPAGLLLHEHVNHFSPPSLAILANKCGLTLFDISLLDCSRPFGFVAVLQKAKIDNNLLPLNPSKLEYIQALSYMNEGRSVIESYYKRLKSAKEMINHVGQNIIIWGANDVCSLLVQGIQLLPSSIIVDSDPNKSNFLNPISVHQPKDVLAQIKEAKLLIITTSRHSKDIEKWILEQAGHVMTDETKIILDYLI
jgi:SAM-dependent methyltransferase